jgi:DegV family protein with EDD domain
MTTVRVVTDSGADIDAQLADRLRIAVVPLTVHFGSEAYLHTEISLDAFWEKVAAGERAGTSQPSLGLFEQAFERLLEFGHDVLCVTITGKHSGTFSSASTAAQHFGDRVRVVDSLALSLAQGFQVLAAAHAALEGLDLAHVAEVVEGVRARTHLLILLDSIEHIQRGGRANALIPVLSRVTKLLHIKPILTMVDGVLELHGLARSYERGLKRIRSDIAQLGPLERLAVMHTRCADRASEMADALAQQLGFPREGIYVEETGPVLGVHAGPGVIGVAAVQKAN